MIALLALVAVAAIAGAFSEGERSDTGAPVPIQPAGPPVTGPAAQKAEAAALRAAGGGSVISVTRDTSQGAAYAIAVKQPDGDVADVRLDRRDRLIGIDSVQSSQDSGDGGD
jgi:hypothetical protein